MSSKIYQRLLERVREITKNRYRIEWSSYIAQCGGGKFWFVEEKNWTSLWLLWTPVAVRLPGLQAYNRRFHSVKAAEDYIKEIKLDYKNKDIMWQWQRDQREQGKSIYKHPKDEELNG